VKKAAGRSYHDIQLPQAAPVSRRPAAAASGSPAARSFDGWAEGWAVLHLHNPHRKSPTPSEILPDGGGCRAQIASDDDNERHASTTQQFQLTA